MYKVEALWKQRVPTTDVTHTLPTPTHHQSFYFDPNKDKNCFHVFVFSARVHAEQLDAVRVPVEADSRTEDQGPDVGDEEVLRLVFLHILKLELGKLLFTHTKTGGKK